ncbi:hypothetical protein N0V82_003907 [Gnomoniopsis sp. IMI 355080]|nr:hypothetical protein N0V82_003907 [Gnomoniopsis sp. IMI 355080]
MGSKRKPESPLLSEPSSKIRRIDANLDHEDFQYSPVVCSPLPEEHVLTPSATSTPAPLTRANLRQLEKMTKSGSKAGRSDSSSKTKSTSKSGKTTSQSDGKNSISTTDPRFEPIFRANGGLSVLKSSQFPPSNKQEIKEYLGRNRGSASPTPDDHNRYIRSLDVAANERGVENAMLGRVFKDTSRTNALQDIDYLAHFDKQWITVPSNVGFNNGLSAPKPDMVEGYTQRSFPPQINELGGSATLVHDNPGYVGLPHFVVESKDYGKSMRQAELQAGYDGATMTYARNRALDFIGDKDPPRRASPMSVATDGHSWTAYSHYAHPKDPKDDNNFEYYQNEVASGRTAEYDDFKRSYKMLRNAQDWGRKESHDLRERMQRHEDLRAKQAADVSKTGSATGDKVGSSAYSSVSDRAAQAPPSRASDTRSRRSDGQASTSSSKSGSKTGYTGTAWLGMKPQAPPSASKVMPPPPRTSSDVVSGRAADQRGRPARSPSTTRYPPSSNSASVSGAGTPRSTRAPSVASGNSDRDRYADPRYSRPEQYRDRRSDDDIQPVQRRRSDSPQDIPRPPRDLDRDRGRVRGSSRIGDSHRRGTSVAVSSSGGRYIDQRSPSPDQYGIRPLDGGGEPVRRRRLSSSYVLKK